MSIEIKNNIGKKELDDKGKIEAFKLRTMKYNSTNPLALPYAGALSIDIWDNLNLDTLWIRDRLQTYFFNLFKYNGMEKQFQRELEYILFRYGKVAIVKLPNGEIVPVNFSHKVKDENFYGTPTKITIHTKNKFNGIKVDEKDFVLGFNNITRVGTLVLGLERIRQTVRALVDVDNNSLITRPRWWVGMNEDDEKWKDVEDAMHSDKAIIPKGNIDLIGGDIVEFTPEDRSVAKQDTYKFQLQNLLKMLGLKTNDSQKAERMSELEIARNDEFDNLLLLDMFDRRDEMLEEVNDKFSQSFSLDREHIEEEKPDEVNGALNKQREVIDNE